MSDVWGEGLPILYGRSVTTGELVHVDDAPNGKACGCVCPDPACSQPLIARNNGKKKIHHFAHIGGTCAWSAEYLLAELALEVVSWRGRIWFPEQSYEERGTYLPKRAFQGCGAVSEPCGENRDKGQKSLACAIEARTFHDCVRYAFVPEECDPSGTGASPNCFGRRSNLVGGNGARFTVPNDTAAMARVDGLGGKVRSTAK